MTQKWERAREAELAVQYCRQTPGVDLMWGIGCEDWSCDCRVDHPGFDKWHNTK